MIKVIKNKVFDGVKTYEVGEVIEGLSENDKSQLVSDGIAEYVYVIPEKSQAITHEIIADILKVDEPLVDIVAIEEAKEEEQSIDPSSFALNAEEYVNVPAVETKKKK